MHARWKWGWRRTGLLLLTALTSAACTGDGPVEPGSQRGLKAGTYELLVDFPDALTIPEALRGTHRLRFRAGGDATTAADFSMVSSQRSRPGVPTESGYLTLDPDLLVIEPTSWTIVLSHVADVYSIRFVIRDNTQGGFTIPAGCLGRIEGGGSYQGSGCRLERL